MISVFSLYINDFKEQIVTCECDIAAGLPGFCVSGLAGKTIEESFIRIKQAIKNSLHETLINKFIINLSPSDIKKDSNLFDLSLAIAIYILHTKEKFPITSKEPIILNENQNIINTLSSTLFFGELGIDGSLKAGKNFLPYILRANKEKFRTIVLPHDNYSEFIKTDLCSGLIIFPCKTLQQVIDFVYGKTLNSSNPIPFHINESSNDSNNYKNNLDIYKEFTNSNPNPIIKNFTNDFSHFIGQRHVKRGLLIAAAGFHSLHLYGPAGCGKTLLANMFSEILPPLTKQEMLELTDLYAYFNIIQSNTIVKERPKRTPHHSSTLYSITGGGTPLTIGEISLAHRGLMILDEINLFSKKTLEALREPIEEQHIEISRVNYKVSLPSSFLLILISNLCKCGNLGSEERLCHCTPKDQVYFSSHISQALKDRIDISLSVNEEDFYLSETDSIYTSQSMYEQILKAFEKQQQRYKNTGIIANGKIPKNMISQFIKITSEVEAYLLSLSKKRLVSFRKIEKIIKLAQTIADINNHTIIEFCDIEEAVFFALDKKFDLTFTHTF